MTEAHSGKRDAARGSRVRILLSRGLLATCALAVLARVPRLLAQNDAQEHSCQLVGGYYPSFGKFLAIVDVAGHPDAERLTRVVVEIRRCGDPALIASGDIATLRREPNPHARPAAGGGLPTGLMGETVIDAPGLEGEYEATLRLFAGDDERQQKTPASLRFERYRQEWEHNTIGMAQPERNTIGVGETVYPPFTPLEVRGETVCCVLRAHELGALGLWRQVRSMDRPLLATPMRLELISRGKTVAWSAAAAPKFVERSGHRVVHEAQAESDVLAVASRGVWDYDGAVRCELTLEPRGDGQVDELALVLPLREEEAPLFHACAAYIRTNPQGYTPAGTGVVWDSRSATEWWRESWSTRKDGSKGRIGNFIPYIWLGGPERGIAWWADNSRGWVIDDESALFQIVRTDGRVDLRVRFVNRPGRLRGRRDIVFGLMATPAKPQPQGGRGWGYSPRPMKFNLHSAQLAGLSDNLGLMPMGNDWEGVRQLARMCAEGKYDKNAVMPWLLKHAKDHDAERVRAVRAVFDGLARVKGRELILYTDPKRARVDTQTPQGRTFALEWFRGGNTASFNDYAAYAFDKMLECGLGGVYHDNAYPYYLWDVVTGPAYTDEEGRLRVGYDMWARRALYKRLYAAGWERTKRQPVIVVHNTNAHVVPWFSFATMGYGPEWCQRLGEGYANTFQDAFPFDLLRAGTAGKQSGLIQVVLSHYWRAAEDLRPYLKRTLAGVALLHDMSLCGEWQWQTFGERLNERAGYFDPGVQVLPYWSNGEYVTCDPDVEVTLYRHGTSVLAVACSVITEEPTHYVKPQPPLLPALGKTLEIAAVDDGLPLADAPATPAPQRAPTHKHWLQLNLEQLGLPENLWAADFEIAERLTDNPAFGRQDDRDTVRQVGPGRVEFELRRHDFKLILFTMEPSPATPGMASAEE